MGTLLRPDVLAGVVVALSEAGDELGGHLEGHGARVERLGTDAAPGAEAALRRHGRVDVLVHDAGAAFARAGADGLDAFRAAVDGVWAAARAVALAAWIPDEREGGKAILVAPPPGAGPHAAATRAALENAARTLSIEWARYGIRTVAVTPGDATAAADVHALCAFLASRAGDYYSGCRFDLGAV